MPKLKYDAEVDILFIDFRDIVKGPIKRIISDPFEENQDFFLEYDEETKVLLGVEIVNASHYFNVE